MAVVGLLKNQATAGQATGAMRLTGLLVLFCLYTGRLFNFLSVGNNIYGPGAVSGQ
jgi:hypothetical protein